jgi:hypothetical protein
VLIGHRTNMAQRSSKSMQAIVHLHIDGTDTQSKEAQPERGGGRAKPKPLGEGIDTHTEAVPRPSESAVEGSSAALAAGSARPNLTRCRHGATGLQRKL